MDLSHDGAFASTLRLVGVLRLLDLPDEELEGLGHVLVIPGAGFSPGTVDLLSQLLALLGADLALLGSQIALVTNNYNRYPLDSLAKHCMLVMAVLITAEKGLK